MIKSEEPEVNSPPWSLAPAPPLAYQVLRDGRAGEETSFGFRFSLFNLLPYGIGLVGRGATPQMADAQGGRGGVGIRVLFPCVAAVPPVMQSTGKGILSGYGLVKPSVRVCRKATIWFSSLSVKPSIPVVLSTVAVTSGLGQQVTLSTVPGGQCPEVTSGWAKLVSACCRNVRAVSGF